MTCHVAFDPSSRFVAASNYDDGYFFGSFMVCELDKNGILSKPQIFVMHTGSGPDKSRQASSHIHQCVFEGETLWVCDLGMDIVDQYVLDEDMARLQRQLRTPPGSGARHMAIDGSGRYVYVICEMASLIATYDLSRPGNLDSENLYMLTDGSPGEGSPGRTGAAAIRYRKDGLLLATNRYKDNISLYKADGATLELINRVGCGKTPRDGAFVRVELVSWAFRTTTAFALYDISAGKFKQVRNSPSRGPHVLFSL